MYSFLDSLSTIKKQPPLNAFILHQLLPIQVQHTIRLIDLIDKYQLAIDQSDTGVGKTYVAAAICCHLNKKPVIVCPKSLMYEWKRVMMLFGIVNCQIVNYETIRLSKAYDDCFSNCRQTSTIIQSTCNYPYYHWNLPLDSLVIFDEVHRCKDSYAINGKLLISTKTLIHQKIPLLLLSATLCEKYLDLGILFYLMDVIETPQKLSNYLKRAVKVTKNKQTTIDHYQTLRRKAQLLHLHHMLNHYSARIKITQMMDHFPDNLIVIQKFVLANTVQIKAAYARLSSIDACHLPKIQKLKQCIELEKVPIFVQLGQAYLRKGYSVVFFVNYLKSLHAIATFLSIECKIYGGQTLAERTQSIAQFQNNSQRLIICQMKAGEVGISLHDLNGSHPRVSLINYPDSGLTLMQVLGRTARACAQSAVKQIIVFAANVHYEETIAQSIDQKLFNIKTISDGYSSGLIEDLSLTVASNT